VHVFFIREAFRSMRHHRGLVTTAVFSLVAALTLSGIFLLIAHNARAAWQMVGERRLMVVYLNDDVTASRRDALIGRLEALYGSVSYVSKDSAWAEFSEQVGDPALLEAVDTNPLPSSLRIRLRPELLNHAAMEQAAKQVSQFPEVEDVRFGGDWVRRLDEIRNGLTTAALLVGALVAMAVLLVLYNTIRLTVLARRPQVEIMSRLGASDRFIATPFVIEAVLEALIAGAVALALVFGFQQAMQSQIGHVAFLPWSWSLAFVGAVVALGWFAAMLAFQRVLRMVGP
jgi:cell division transport system permease protein